MSTQAQPWRTRQDLPGQCLSSAPDAAAVTAPLNAASQSRGNTYTHTLTGSQSWELWPPESVSQTIWVHCLHCHNHAPSKACAGRTWVNISSDKYQILPLACRPAMRRCARRASKQGILEV